MNVNFLFHILVGLPGSGKTYWATHNFPTPSYVGNHRGRFIVSLDDHIGEANWIENAFNDELINYCKELHCINYNNNKIEACIDGPLTNVEHVITVIDNVMMYMKNNCKYSNYSLSFIIHQWDENREYCLHNDKYRQRKTKANISISMFNYVKINNNFLKLIEKHIDNFQLKHNFIVNVKPIKKIEHMVEKSTMYDQVFVPACDNKYGHGNDPKETYMYSEEWSLGGEWGNCWGEHGSVSPEEAKDFTELDEFLEKVAPQISFLQYKKIKNNCVEQIDWHVHDYYSSGTYDACWRCDMKKLYNMLKEMNYIED